MPDRNKNQSSERRSPQRGSRQQDQQGGRSRQQEQQGGRSRQQGEMDRDSEGRFENR